MAGMGVMAWADMVVIQEVIKAIKVIKVIKEPMVDTVVIDPADMVDIQELMAAMGVMDWADMAVDIQEVMAVDTEVCSIFNF
jgi:hypothetical protein